ncbi:hypothetical protein MNEG_8474, partial [Monoraphidium neglectum]
MTHQHRCDVIVCHSNPIQVLAEEPLELWDFGATPSASQGGRGSGALSAHGRSLMDGGAGGGGGGGGKGDDSMEFEDDAASWLATAGGAGRQGAAAAAAAA